MIWTDLRYSARSLARSRGLTATLLLTIALGIGSNAAVAGFVRGLVTRNLPLPGLEGIVSAFAKDEQNSFGPLSYTEYQSLKAQSDTFDFLGAARESRNTVVVDGRSSVLSVVAITPELADLFQLSLRGGVVVSHRMWQDEFGGKADVAGERVRIDDAQQRVAGVAPEWLEGLYVGSAVDIWTSLEAPRGREVDRTGQDFWTFGRLRRGISLYGAQAAINAARQDGNLIAVLRYTGMPPEVSGAMVRMGALLTSAATAVFFIACANVATFLLSRASARSRESSVRIALGASRGQIARQLLADAVVISVVGAALGVLLAIWTSRIVPSLLFDKDAEKLVFIPDLVGTIVASIACAAVMILCGLIPLFETRHDDPARVLRREGAGPSTAMRRFRAGLIVAQMTCCCLLVISAAILVTGFRSALQTKAGNRLKQTILATVESRFRWAQPEAGVRYFHEIEQAAQSMPTTVTTAWSGAPPGNRPGWQSIRLELPNAPVKDVDMDVAVFTAQSLALVTLPPTAGRMFGAVDTTQSCRVVVINEAARDLLGPDAVGRVLTDPSGQRAEIIGVVGASEEAKKTTRIRPTVYYYENQEVVSPDQIGPGRFRVPARSESTRGVLESNVVSSTYFDVMGLSVIAGGTFTDRHPSSCRIGLVNQDASERYFGGNAVGAAVIDTAGRRTEIVGVVHSVLLRASQRRAEPAIYLPMTQDFLPQMTLIVESREANIATVAAVRERLDAVDGGFGPAFVTTLEAHLTRIALAPERIAMLLVSASAATALVLGVLGLYGAMADAARQRRREFGVRIALGSQAWRLIREVLAEGARLATAGTIAGLIASRLVARWLAQITPAAGPPTLWVWLAAPVALLGAVLIASVLPARVALDTDPLSVMRDE